MCCHLVVCALCCLFPGACPDPSSRYKAGSQLPGRDRPAINHIQSYPAVHLTLTGRVPGCLPSRRRCNVCVDFAASCCCSTLSLPARKHQLRGYMASHPLVPRFPGQPGSSGCGDIWLLTHLLHVFQASQATPDAGIYGFSPTCSTFS